MEKDYVCIDGRNDFYEKHFIEMCNVLERGKKLGVATSVMGHSLNNRIQNEYKNALLEKYGDALVVEFHGGNSYNYTYILEK